MTITRANRAETPVLKTGDPDALSDVLQAVHLRGDSVVRHQAPAEVTYPSGSHTLHIVESGTAQLTVSGGPEVALESGGLALLVHGQEHSVSARQGSWVTGTFSLDQNAADRLFAVLPDVVLVRKPSGGNDWLGLSLNLLLDELLRPRPGYEVMISRILDLLFIHSLRAWAAGGEAPSGWLTAAMDPVLGPVVSAIHRAPGQSWSVERMSRLTNLSRSAFADRFTRLVGQTPGSYVTTQRIEMATHLLGRGASVHEVAATVGYTSDAAFSRAFRRRLGVSPQQWRPRSD